MFKLENTQKNILILQICFLLPRVRRFPEPLLQRSERFPPGTLSASRSSQECPATQIHLCDEHKTTGQQTISKRKSQFLTDDSTWLVLQMASTFSEQQAPGYPPVPVLKGESVKSV